MGRARRGSDLLESERSCRAGLGGKVVGVLNAKTRCLRSVGDAGAKGRAGFSFSDAVLAILAKFTLFLSIAA